MKAFHMMGNREDSDKENFIIQKERFKDITMEEIEKEILLYLLQNNFWNVDKTAEILKQSTRNIYNKLKKYKINRDERWKE